MDKWMMINFKYDNQCKAEVPLTYRSFGGTFYRHYRFVNNYPVSQALEEHFKKYSAAQRLLFSKRHTLYVAEHMQAAAKKANTVRKI